MKPEEQRKLMENTAAPIGALISSIGQGIGEAQQALDHGSAALFNNMYSLGDNPEALQELSKLGYQPTWYQIPEASAEIKLSMNLSQSNNSSGKGTFTMYGTPVDASFSNKFNYDVSLSSKVSFKVVPVPPPAEQQIPNFVGMTLKQAEMILTALKLSYSLLPESVEDFDKESKIEEQNPPAGYLLSESETIQLTVSQKI